MKQEEAESQILHEWNIWSAKNIPFGDRPTSYHGFHFFGYLETEKPELLNFSFPGDKWPCVYTWILRTKQAST